MVQGSSSADPAHPQRCPQPWPGRAWSPPLPSARSPSPDPPAAPASHRERSNARRLLHRTQIARHLDLACCLGLPSCWRGTLSHLASVLLHHSTCAVGAVGCLERRHLWVLSDSPGKELRQSTASMGRDAEQLSSAGSRHLKDLWEVLLRPLSDAGNGGPFRRLQSNHLDVWILLLQKPAHTHERPCKWPHKSPAQCPAVL